MQFSYTKWEYDGFVVHRPMVSIVVAYKGKRSPPIWFLVDTGADKTVLPLEIAEMLSIPLDLTKGEKTNGAGGGEFMLYESLERVDLCIEPPKGFRPLKWKAFISFAEKESIPLLGHKECLEKFNFEFLGRQRKLMITG